MSAENNIALVQDYWNFMNEGNLQAGEDLLAANYVYHGPRGLEVIGPEKYKELITEYYTAFPDFCITINDLFGSGDRVVSRYTATGTHIGEFMGAPPTGNEITFQGIVISRLENGKVAEDWEVLDELSLLMQSGADSENYYLS